MSAPDDPAHRSGREPAPPPGTVPPRAAITVGVVSICGAPHLRRCLAALDAQREAPPFAVLVVHDPALEEVARLAAERPDVRFVSNAGQRTPLELAARAVREASGELLLLTEDHCAPDPDWVRRLASEGAREERAAVGGVVEAAEGCTPLDWAFYLVDFYRYMPPARRGPSASLTVCNVAYRRDRLRAIADLWRELFHETAIHRALAARFGPLWLEPSARVTMRRRVRLRDALYERYAFGRLFGCTRLAFSSPARRLVYAALAPALPALLLGRMARRCARRRDAAARFARAFPYVLLLVLAWSWGEWLGYLTRRRPRSERVAPERPAGEDGGSPGRALGP